MPLCSQAFCEVNHHNLNGRLEAENDDNIIILKEPGRHKPDRAILATIMHTVVKLQECLLN